MNKKEIIESFLKKQYLVSPDFLENYEENNEIIEKIDSKEKPIVITKEIAALLKKDKKCPEVNWIEFEKARTDVEKGKDPQIYNVFLDILLKKELPIQEEAQEITIQQETTKESEKEEKSVIIVKNFIEEENKKREITNFVQYFQARYNTLREILLSRTELQNTISINRVLNRKERERTSIIGMVMQKRTTKNGHIMIELEDPTGTINVLFSKNKANSFAEAQNIVNDEVIGITGTNEQDIIFADTLFFPEIPLSKEIKKIKEDVSVAFISDIHVGSTHFLEKELLQFIDWINGKADSKEEREIAKTIKYIFVLGDLIDGVGVYPGQEENSFIHDVEQQYNQLAKYLSMIRKDISIIMCPGDHDAVRLSHPQPTLRKDYAKAVWDLPNVILATNPSMVNIHSSIDFPGFDVLLYHGHGWHYYVDKIEELRKNDALHNPRFLMKFFLQKRHLAPSHGSTIYVPDIREDHMVIEKVPDIFVAGHLHKSDTSTYRNVITINCSCWQAITDFQIKEGNFPDPCKVPILNLKTRQIIMKDFSIK